MAIYPGAKKKLIGKWNQKRIARWRRMNLHVAVSTADSLYGMFSRSNSACSHFYVNLDGVVEQYIDTKYCSAADLNGGDSTISVETAGATNPKTVNSEEWNDKQFAALVKLWVWARDTHDIKNQVAKNTQTNANSEGLSWHRLGVQGNFSGRKGILSISYQPGGILYSRARGKECPGDAKILQIPEIFDAANGKVKPSTPAKPKPTPAKPSKPSAPAKDKSGSWPQKPLKVTSKHTVESDAAWRELMAAVGYTDKDLGKNLQSWLNDLTDPRTGRPYYEIGPLLHDGVMGPEGVKALQRKLYDTKGDDGKRIYNGYSDGKRGGMTVESEIEFLNLKVNRGVK